MRTGLRTTADVSLGADIVAVLKRGKVLQCGGQGPRSIKLRAPAVSVADALKVVALCSDGGVWTWENSGGTWTDHRHCVRGLQHAIGIAAGYPQNLAIVRGP